MSLVARGKVYILTNQCVQWQIQYDVYPNNADQVQLYDVQTISQIFILIFDQIKIHSITKSKRCSKGFHIFIKIKKVDLTSHQNQDVNVI